MASDGEVSCLSDPNFAILCSFLEVFGKLCLLEIPTIEELQQYLENTQEVVEPLRDLHVRLLRKALKSVQSNKWERGLIKFCHQIGCRQEAWEIERFTYKKSSTQVKLKVLKNLLEYQFTCHTKFKASVNSLSSKDLRLSPMGRDKCGRIYWLNIDDEANLCLYREDQDEETWELLAKDREGLVKIIAALKSGDDDVTNESIINEDSNSVETPIKLQEEKCNNESNEEFLSPDTESDKECNIEIANSISKENKDFTEKEETSEDNLQKDESLVIDEKGIDANKQCDKLRDYSLSDSKNNEIINKFEKGEGLQLSNETESTIISTTIEEPLMLITGEGSGADCDSCYILGEEIIEPIMYIWGDGCGLLNDTGNPDVTDPITENDDVKNHTPNDLAPNENDDLCKESASSKITDYKGKMRSGNKKLNLNSASANKRYLKIPSVDTNNSIKTENNSKKQCTRNSAKTTNPDSCVNNSTELNPDDSRSADTGDIISYKKSSRKYNKNNKLKKNDIKKSEVKTRLNVKNAEGNTGCNSNNTIRVDDSKLNIIEKRKNSVSSSDQDRNERDSGSNTPTNVICHKTQDSIKDTLETPKNDTETLPSKKLRLDNSNVQRDSIEKQEEEHQDLKNHPEDRVGNQEIINTSDESSTFIIRDGNIESSNCEQKDANNTLILEKTNMLTRKRIKKRSKGKTKKAVNVNQMKNDKDPLTEYTNEKNVDDVNDKCDQTTILKEAGEVKSPKTCLTEIRKRIRHKSESISEDENEEPLSGKRLKIKSKKINLSNRKKVEEKLKNKISSEESEVESCKKGKSVTKKNSSTNNAKNKKKIIESKVETAKQEKKSKKDNASVEAVPDESDTTPVRQSRRIAQLKIKEEADRRHMEEVALRELKLKHKKKKNDEEDDWKASSSEEEVATKESKVKHIKKWCGSESTGPPSDSESDEHLFEHVHEEPDLDFSKSDHEFSPESDLENEDSTEPLKIARTLQDGSAEGFCARCGSGEQPEWILLCDSCDAGYHASCLKPVLFLIPEGDWFCPPCQHAKLIAALEEQLVKYDKLIIEVEPEKLRKQKVKEELKKLQSDKKEEETIKSEDEESSEWSSSEEDGTVYRLRERRQLPVSYHAREYDRIMSTAIKEEYVEPSNTAGNQGRGKDISTIIEAAEEEKLKAEIEAVKQGQIVQTKKVKRKPRRKSRKLNSLDVLSEDDNDTDEDFKDTGVESTSEEISSEAEKGSDSEDRSSDSLPIRRSSRKEKKDRKRIVESPELKKKKGVFSDTSSESSGAKDWSEKSKKKFKLRRMHSKHSSRMKKRKGLTQYDAEGNVIRARVTYGGLSGSDDMNDWSPKHRTRQKKINYTEMPNTESEDEMHKSSGKHMPDSSDEFRIDESEVSSDSDSDRNKRKIAESDHSEQEKNKETLLEMTKKTAIVPLEKLSEEVTKAKTEALEALRVQAAEEYTKRPTRGKGSRGGRGIRGPRGGGRGAKPRKMSSNDNTDESLSNLIGLKIKDLAQMTETFKPNQAEREKKRLEKEARQAEKESRKQERQQKKEEKEKLKEQRAKEREEKRLARIAMQESKRMKKEKMEVMPMPVQISAYNNPAIRQQMRPDMQRMPNMYHNMQIRHPGERFPTEQRFPLHPRLQVRPELRAMQPDLANVRAQRLPLHGSSPRMPPHPMNHPDRMHALREGTLSVAGSPQPFKPSNEAPSIITRMPHMIPQQYRGPMIYGPANAGYGHPRGPPQNVGMYPMHHPHVMNPSPPGGGPIPPRHQYPGPGPGYYPQQLHAIPPAYPPAHMPPRLPVLQHIPQPPAPSTPGTPPVVSTPTSITSEGSDLPKIKSEIKTEPEFSQDSNDSPSGSFSPKEEPLRVNHPKIKHTENKDRRPRFPLGPYAPQYGPYGPYAPPISTAPTEQPQALVNMQHHRSLPINNTELNQMVQLQHPHPNSNIHQIFTSNVQNLNAKNINVDNERITPSQGQPLATPVQIENVSQSLTRNTQSQLQQTLTPLLKSSHEVPSSQFISSGSYHLSSHNLTSNSTPSPQLQTPTSSQNSMSTSSPICKVPSPQFVSSSRRHQHPISDSYNPSSVIKSSVVQVVAQLPTQSSEQPTISLQSSSTSSSENSCPSSKTTEQKILEKKAELSNPILLSIIKEPQSKLSPPVLMDLQNKENPCLENSVEPAISDPENLSPNQVPNTVSKETSTSIANLPQESPSIQTNNIEHKTDCDVNINRLVEDPSTKEDSNEKTFQTVSHNATRDEVGSVFGGLVSYFSSQREDDIDS